MRESAGRCGLEYLDWDSGKELTETLHLEEKEGRGKRRRYKMMEQVCLHMGCLGESKEEESERVKEGVRGRGSEMKYSVKGRRT